MDYRMEPIEDSHLCEWMIELEVGGGIGQRLALITDLTGPKTTKLPDGKLSVTGARTLTLPLDEVPTSETACEIADELALALLESGKAKPAHLVRYVLHKGLCAATAHKQPDWQHCFRYVVSSEAHTDWWCEEGQTRVQAWLRSLN